MVKPPILMTRPAEVVDISSLMNIDLKCFDYPWTQDMWRECPYNCSVTAFAGTPVGLVAYTDKPLKFPGSDFVAAANAVWIVKLGVKPEFRLRGMGSSLLDRVVDFAAYNQADKILTITPETDCYTRILNFDLNDWLQTRKFRAQGLIHNCFTEYGEQTDGVLWQRNLK